MRLLTALIGACTLAAPAVAQAPSLTIYNDGRVLVRRSIPARVPRGPSTHRIEVGALDLATVFSRDSLVTIIAASYDGATDMQSVIRRSIGRRITFRYGGVKDTVSAKVLAVDPERYEMPDGTVTFSMPGTPQFPRDLVVVDPVVSLSVESRRAREGFDLGYFTSGGSWQASYQVILGAKAARVQGSAVVAVDRLSVEGASVQLLAGSVGRAAQMRDETRFRRNVAAVAEMTVAGVVAIEERVGEFHLYTLPGTLNLAPGIETSRALFEPATTGYERRYVVRGFLPYRGPLVQTGEEPQSPVEVRYRIERKSGSEFGDTPLPGGVIRLYQADEGGRLQLVGEANVDHTPAGRDVTVSAGLAFDITAKRVQTSYTTVRQGRYTVATADYEVTLANATDQAVTVDVLEERFGEWSILESSVPAEKVSSTVTRFRVLVPAKGETTLTYQVRARW